MTIYRVSLVSYGMDDSFYFDKIPTQANLRNAIVKNQALAGNIYHKNYDNLLFWLPEIMEYVIKFSGSRCEYGGPIQNGSASFNRIRVTELK